MCTNVNMLLNVIIINLSCDQLAVVHLCKTVFLINYILAVTVLITIRNVAVTCKCLPGGVSGDMMSGDMW